LNKKAKKSKKVSHESTTHHPRSTARWERTATSEPKNHKKYRVANARKTTRNGGRITGTPQGNVRRGRSKKSLGVLYSNQPGKNQNPNGIVQPKESAGKIKTGDQKTKPKGPQIRQDLRPEAATSRRPLTGRPAESTTRARKDLRNRVRAWSGGAEEKPGETTSGRGQIFWNHGQSGGQQGKTNDTDFEAAKKPEARVRQEREIRPAKPQRYNTCRKSDAGPGSDKEVQTEKKLTKKVKPSLGKEFQKRNQVIEH